MRWTHAIVEALQLTARGLLVDRGADHYAVAAQDLVVDEVEVVVADGALTGAAFFKQVDDAGVAAGTGLDVQVVKTDQFDLGSGLLGPISASLTRISVLLLFLPQVNT